MVQVALVDAVGKDKDIPIVEHLRIMLAAHLIALIFPYDPVLRVEDKDQVQVFELMR